MPLKQKEDQCFRPTDPQKGTYDFFHQNQS